MNSRQIAPELQANNVMKEGGSMALSLLDGLNDQLTGLH